MTDRGRTGGIWTSFRLGLRIPEVTHVCRIYVNNIVVVHNWDRRTFHSTFVAGGTAFAYPCKMLRVAAGDWPAGVAYGTLGYRCTPHRALRQTGRTVAKAVVMAVSSRTVAEGAIILLAGEVETV